MMLSQLGITLDLGFRREVDESCTLMGYYAVDSGNFLLTLRDNQSVPSSGDFSFFYS